MMFVIIHPGIAYITGNQCIPFRSNCFCDLNSIVIQFLQFILPADHFHFFPVSVIGKGQHNIRTGTQEFPVQLFDSIRIIDDHLGQILLILGFLLLLGRLVLVLGRFFVFALVFGKVAFVDRTAEIFMRLLRMIIVPLVLEQGYDVIWFGTLMIVLIEMALIPPPVAAAAPAGLGAARAPRGSADR